MKAILISVGDELLIGQVTDTNATWIGEQLDLLGISLVRHVTIGDDEAAIQAELHQARSRFDLILFTGGLGPTSDDVTRDAVAACLEVSLGVNARVQHFLEQWYQKRGREMPVAVGRQALVPEGFLPLMNPVGTAPGLYFESDPRAQVICLLPGVPREMKAIFQADIIPRLKQYSQREAKAHRTLLTAGLGETGVAELLAPQDTLENLGLKLAFLPSEGIVRLRLSARGTDHQEVESRLEEGVLWMQERLGKHVFGTEPDTLEAAVGRLLIARKATIAVAESCTGGLIQDRLTNTSGSSGYLLGGVVAYANKVKTDLLEVSPDMVAEQGAVSEGVAIQMAKGVRKKLGATIGLSTTGIAGPGGGTPQKPVGMVWVGYSDADRDVARSFLFGQDRLLNKMLFSTYALDLVRRMLSNP